MVGFRPQNFGAEKAAAGVSPYRATPKGPHTQRSHIYSCKRFAAFLKRSPDTATPVALATVWRRNAHHHL